VSLEREILTPEEAADFLRLSVSTVYQRKDIPRHRLPNSRQIRFVRSELLSWLTGGLMTTAPVPAQARVEPRCAVVPRDVDIPNGRVYHRNARYR